MSRKRIIIASAVFLLTVGVIVAVSILLDARKGEIKETPVHDISREIDNFAESKDTEAALNYFDEQIDLRESAEDKKTILVMKSRFALREGKEDEALQAARRAHDLGRDAVTTRSLAEIYAEMGNKERAIAYYRELIDLLSKSGQTVQRGPSIEDLIEELEK